MLMLIWGSSHAALEIRGTRYITEIPAKTTGLEAVYILENSTSASLSYTASSPAAANAVEWMRFSSLGGGFAEPISNVTVSGTTSTIELKDSDMGYIVNDGGRQTAYWIIDYAKHLPTLTTIVISPEHDCDRVAFDPVGGFDRIMYYSVNGAPTELNRGIVVEYNDLELQQNGDEGTWTSIIHTVTEPYINGRFSVMAPLCDTPFTISGDRFLTAWGDPISISTPTYKTGRVEAATWAVQDARDNNNEQNNSTSGLGGSAPCDITFYAAPTDAVVFHEWQFSKTEDFEDIVYRFNEDIFTYTFTEYGTTYVRYECGDATGNCMYQGDVYTIMIGESKLLCPNAFSPQNQDGVNDEWKVSYSSLVSYECHIFNRWGKELFSSTNPAEGWNGKQGNKFVPSGVYFYVIKAEGADGVKYNLSGDINIVGSKLKTNTESNIE